MDKHKRVLVTGATGTLGSALVAELVAAGYKVTANYHRDTPRAERLMLKTGCHLVQGDISDEGFVNEIFEQKFDAVFHLAAVSFDSLLPRISSASWQERLKINLTGAFLVTRAALRTLPAGGKLVLVSSRVGERGYPGQAAYGASKSAILGLMKSAASEGREMGIAVNAICPGFAPSEMSVNLSEEVLAVRAAENWLEGADARQSFSALCLALLQAKVSGQIFHPDCRM